MMNFSLIINKYMLNYVLYEIILFVFTLVIRLTVWQAYIIFYFFMHILTMKGHHQESYTNLANIYVVYRLYVQIC
jgi:hypothetical protein